MKTALTRIALLLLTIQGIVNAQVSTSSVRNTKQNPLGPTIQHRNFSNAKATATTDNTVAVVNDKVNDLTERISQIDKQIEELMQLKAGLDAEKKEYLVTEKTNLVPQESTETNLNSNSLYVSQVDKLLDLQNEANDFYQNYIALITEAKTKNGSTKAQLQLKAKSVFQQYELTQINASELAAELAITKYNSNKITITQLKNDYTGISIVITQINQLTTEADQFMRMAKEIREEAKAQPNNSAKIGVYSNAEEKETLALNKQDEAIKIFEKTAQLHFTILINDLAFN